MNALRSLPCAFSIVLLLASAASAQGPDEKTPTATIDALHEQLTKVMKVASELTFEERAKALTPPVQEAFDLNMMGVTVLGPGGRDLSKTDLERWIDTFTRFTVANYARRFTGYSGQAFETLGEEEAPRNTMLVRSRLVRPDDEDVQIDYRMRKTGGGWKIIDVYSKGTVSELALRRAEFAPALADEGLDALIKSVDGHSSKQ